MTNWPAVIIGILAVGIFLWLLIPSRSDPGANRDAEFIDPHNSAQLGLLMGIYGGDIPDAAIMRYALDRFQREYGRARRRGILAWWWE